MIIYIYNYNYLIIIYYKLNKWNSIVTLLLVRINTLQCILFRSYLVPNCYHIAIKLTIESEIEWILCTNLWINPKENVCSKIQHKICSFYKHLEKRKKKNLDNSKKCKS